MANGKFSKPRNSFSQEELPEYPTEIAEDTGSEAEVLQESAPESEELIQEMPQSLTGDPETEAMDRAFEAVSEKEGFRFPYMDLLLRHRKSLLIGGCALVLVVLAAIIGAVFLGRSSDPYDGKILNNVTVGGIHVGGLTRSQAENVLRSATDSTFSQQDMVVLLPDTSLRFSPDQTGAKLDVKAAVKAAYQYGRTGTAAQQEAAYEASLTGNHIIPLLPYLQLDTDYILSTIQGYADSFGTDYTEASYRVEGEMPALVADLYDPAAPCQTLVITMGTPGMGVDVDELYEMVLDAYSFNTFVVEGSTLPSSEPAIPDVDAIYAQLYIAPVNTTMNNQTFEEIPGSYGYGFDLEKAKALVAAAGHGESVNIPMECYAPEIMEGELLFQDILGYCETPHSNNEKRTRNLEIVCQMLNGLVLNPGEELSYNQSVGERTAERGFQAAPAYSGTKLVDSIGGGVCQGSSTLYYCALVAEMEITDRINHGFPVTYMPKGLDATVSWYGPDFKFRNSSSFPIKLQAEVSGGYMRMWILGTEVRDYYVKLDSEITRIITPEEVVVEYDSDSGYKDGEVLEGGTTGYMVRSYMYKYSRETDELLSKDFIALSSYMTEKRVVVKIVDKKPDKEETEPTKATTAPTEAPTTQPPTTQPPETTAPPTTQPPETTAPPTTQPPETTAPPTTQPPETTAPPTTQPPETTAPPTTQPPETTAPPTTQPPADEGGE